ncbi:hypothetical protein C0992_011555 [Termitomyces sp. T32_za158]|nr:hypothetical protein C0992_011555 [Termitomyces sp. T32_za158]
MAEEDVPMTATETPAVPEESKAETSTSATAAVETAPAVTEEEDAELKTKAAAQIEFYFADANLPYDK